MPYRGNCRPWQKVELLWVLSISACTRIARPGMADKCIDEKATNQPHQPLTVRQRKRVRCFKFFLWILKTNARLDFLLLLFIVKFCAKVVLKTLPSLKFNWSCCDCENACLTFWKSNFLACIMCMVKFVSTCINRIRACNPVWIYEA